MMGREKSGDKTKQTEGWKGHNQAAAEGLEKQLQGGNSEFDDIRKYGLLFYFINLTSHCNIVQICITFWAFLSLQWRL